MYKLIAAKYSLIATVVVGVSHAFSHGWIYLENGVASVVSEAKAQAVAELAEKAGYIKPIIDSEGMRRVATKEAQRRGIAPTLVLANMHQESGTAQNLSHAGAVGPLQVMPFNAKRCGLKPKELLEPEKNIMCGVQILAEDLAAEKMNVNRALQRYNGGPGCINKCAESINHARAVETIKNKLEKGQ